MTKVVLGERKKRIKDKEEKVKKRRQRLSLDELEELVLDLIDELREKKVIE